MLRGCHAVTAVTQPRSRSGEDDGKGRVGERRGENVGVRHWGKAGKEHDECVLVDEEENDKR